MTEFAIFKTEKENMNKVGVSFAYWAHEWDADLKPFILRAKKTGMEVLEIMSGSLMDAPDAHIREVGDLAASNDIQLAMGLTLDEKTDISSEDDGIRDAGIKRVTRVLDVMDKLDCRLIGGLTYGAWGGKVANMDEKKRRTDRSVESVKRFIKIAEDFGITFCVEVVNRFEQYMINTAAEAREYIERVGSPSGGICLDTFHMNIEESDMAGAFRTAGKLLAHVHVGENNRRVPGTGEMDWGKLMAALKEIDYKNAVVMEPFLRAGDAVGDAVALWRDLSGDAGEARMDEMIAKGAAFIRGKL